MQNRVCFRTVASGSDSLPSSARTPSTPRRIWALLVPALTVFMLAQVRPVVAQSPIEGYWDDRFARDIYGGLSLRAEDIVTHPETGEVYVGGNFPRWGDLDLNYLAKWTGDGWEAIGQGANHPVRAIAFAPNGDMYIGGTFTEVYQSDGTPLAAVRVARWDGTRWHALGGGIPSTVEVIAALPSGNIVVGGNFDSAENPGGQRVDVQNIAVWDGSGWGTLGAGVNNTVRALVVHPPTGDLIAGGSFVEAYNPDGSTVSSRSVVRWTGSEWRDVGGGLNGGLDDLAIGFDGTIYAAGSGAPGLIGGFDGTAWTALGGGIPGIYARAVAFGNNKVFVGGQFEEVENSDGSRLRSTNIAAFDLDTGEWVSLEPGTSNTVTTLAYDGSAVFAGGGFEWAGPFPAQYMSRWIDSPPTYPSAPVTFRVDVRRLQDLGLLPLSRSVMLEVFDGANAKRFGLLDPDGDGVHSVRVPQPIGGTIRYAFFIDIDRNGFEGDNSWVFERDITTNPRTLSIQSADPVVLPIAYFDDLPPVPFAADFEASSRADKKPGNPATSHFFRGVNQAGATIDLELLDRTIRLAAFMYASDPGGTAPEGIVRVAQSTYWRFETTPLAARFSGSVFLEFLPGVSAPEDVRVLYRPAADSAWQIMESEVDAGGEGIIAQNVTRLSGEWTMGTVSHLNALTDDPPGIVFDPHPVDGTLNAPLTPTLTWEHAEGAELYDLYIWPSGAMEPSSPTAANLDQPFYQATGLTGSAGSATFSWRVVAHNINGETQGPIWSLEIGPAADLNVGDVQAPASAFSGQQIEVIWAVENEGAGGTSLPAWHDEVYLSDAPIFNASAATSLGRVRNVSYLNPGESYQSRATVDLPQGIQGTNYIHVVADVAGRSGGEIAEPDEENNTSEGTVIQVTLTPYADLQVESIIAPDNAFSGDEIEISWTVQNWGPGQTDVPTWFDSIFLSEDAALDFNFAPQDGLTTIRINDPHLASTERSGALEAGESYTANARFKLPDDAIGDFYLSVYTDIQGGVKQPERGDVYEFNQELNNWKVDSIRITLTPPPDLVVTDIEAPAGAPSGEPVELSWTVTNEGPGTTRAEVWVDLVYYSSTPVFDVTTAALLGNFRHNGALSNDASYTASARVRVPDGASGPGYFFVHTNSSGTVFEHTFDENNIGGSTQPSSVTRSPYPDLAVSRINVSPTTATAGQQVAVSYEVGNTGTAVADAWTDRIYVHSSPQWDPAEAFLVGTIPQQMPLLSDASREHSTSVTLPPELDGPYYVYVWTDADEVLFEFPDEQGNVARSAAYTAGTYPPVDLRAEIVSIPESASSGSLVELEVGVRNVGEGRTTAEGWTDEIFLSEDASLEPESDIFLDSAIHEGFLAGGAEYVIRKNVTLPEGLAGDYFFIVRTDADGFVADVEAANNVVAEPIDIVLSPAVDLRVTQIVAPSPIAAADAVTIRWTVANEGHGNTPDEGWFDGVYLSEDERLDRRDILLGTRERTEALAAGSSYQASLIVSLPAYNSGRYYLLVHADQRDDVYEHEAEFDNTANLRVDLTLSPPADLTVEDVTAPAQATPGEPVTVEWTLVNQGDNPAGGRMREAVFISNDPTWDPDDRLLGVAEIDVNLAPGGSNEVALKVDLSRTFEADKSGNIAGELPGVVPGDYYAIVRTDIANNIRETAEDNNTMSSTSATSVDVQVLELEVPETYALSTGQSRLYRLEVDEGRDLRLTLTSDVELAANEIYVAFERPPSASGDFDHSASEPFVADHQLIVPSTKSGTYYVLVSTHSFPDAGTLQTLTLLAELLDFSITSITPDVGGQGQVTTTIHGAGFRETTDVSLVNDEGEQIAGELIEFISTTEMKVKFQFESASRGVYDVGASNQDNTVTTLREAFSIEATKPLQVIDFATAPDFIRAEGSARYEYEVHNASNVDIPYLVVQTLFPSSVSVKVSSSSDLKTFADRSKDPNAEIAFDIGDLSGIDLIARNVPPGTVHDVVFEFSSFNEATFQTTFVSQLFTASEYLSSLGEVIESSRQLLLASPELIGSTLADHAASEEAFRTFFFDEFITLDILDPSDVDNYEAKRQNDLNQTISKQGIASSSAAILGEQVSSRASEAIIPTLLNDDPRPGTLCDQRYQECVDRERYHCGVYHILLCGAISLYTGGAAGIPCGFYALELCRVGPKRKCRPVKKSCDPNDIIGPSGYSAEKWVSNEEVLPYKIRFENDPELASASAQVVGITHPLDMTVDPRRFRLGSFGFGPFTFDPPENVSYYQTRLDVADSIGVDVDVTAGIDILAGNAFWTFKSIDPATGDQPSSDPFAGFLPVNDDMNVGEGFATYTILPAEDAATGDIIDAQASIVFDINAPIDTPPVFNTIDATPPVSSVGVQPARSDTATFYVFWSGEDEGSGIRDFQLFVSRDDEPFELYQSATADTSLLFTGEMNSTYQFFSIGTDNVGNVEPMKSRGEAVTAVFIEGGADPGLPEKFALHQNYPNPFNPRTTIPFDVAEHGEVQIAVYNILGQRVHVLRQEQMNPGHYQQSLDMSQFASGVYFYEIRVRGEGRVRFRDVKKFVLVK